MGGGNSPTHPNPTEWTESQSRIELHMSDRYQLCGILEWALPLCLKTCRAARATDSQVIDSRVMLQILAKIHIMVGQHALNTYIKFFYSIHAWS